MRSGRSICFSAIRASCFVSNRQGRTKFSRAPRATQQTRRGTDEKSRLGARSLLVRFPSRLRLCPRNSDPRQGRRPARLRLARSISSLSPPAKLTLSDKNVRPTQHDQSMVREQAVTVGLSPMGIRTPQPEGCSARRSIRGQTPLTVDPR
jgi:hypothetical protein